MNKNCRRNHVVTIKHKQKKSQHLCVTKTTIIFLEINKTKEFNKKCLALNTVEVNRQRFRRYESSGCFVFGPNSTHINFHYAVNRGGSRCYHYSTDMTPVAEHQHYSPKTPRR